MLPQGWFSQHPQAITQQRVFLRLFELEGIDITTLGEVYYTIQSAKDFIVNMISKHWEDQFIQNAIGSHTQENIVLKVKGDFFEHLTFAFLSDVSISRNLLPMVSHTSKIRHRAEFNIPDMFEGSPDGILEVIRQDTNDIEHYYISCKDAGYRTKLIGPGVKSGTDDKVIFPYKNINNAFPFIKSVDKGKRVYRDNTGILLNFVNEPAIMVMAGIPSHLNTDTWDYIISAEEPNSIYTLLDAMDPQDPNNTTPLMNSFWRLFWNEFLLNVTTFDVTNSLNSIIPLTLDHHQQTHIVDVVNSRFGQMTVQADTGLGKTLCQAKCLTEATGFNLYVAGTRLVLANQNLRELMYNSTNKDFLILCSENPQNVLDKILDPKIKGQVQVRSETDINDICNILMDRYESKNTKPLTIITIYKSYWKIAEAIRMIQEGEVFSVKNNRKTNTLRIDPSVVETYWSTFKCWLKESIAQYDEAHNIVVPMVRENDTDEETTKMRNVKACIYLNMLFKRSVYWTATPLYNCGKYSFKPGSTLFGDVVSATPASVSIALGRTIPVAPVIITGSELTFMNSIVLNRNEESKKQTDQEYQQDIIEINFILKAIETHKKWCDILGIDCRLIVFNSSTTYLKEFCEIIKETFPEIYANFVTANTPQTERETTFAAYQEKKFSILLNYRIVHEGVNFPGTTAVILCRDMNEIGVIQAVGRARRLLPEDLKDISLGLIKKGDYQNYRKPHCQLYIFEDTDVLASANSSLHVQNILKTLQNYSPDNFIIVDQTQFLGPRGKRDPEIINKQVLDKDELRLDFSQFSILEVNAHRLEDYFIGISQITELAHIQQVKALVICNQMPEEVLDSSWAD